MKSDITLGLEQFKKPLLILNGISFIMSVWFTYKYYFSNDGKGIDEIFYAFSLFTLQSFFGLVALTKIDNIQACKKWLLIGIVYIVLAAVFVEIELFKSIYFVAVIPFVFYLIPMFLKSPTQIFNSVKGAFIFGFIPSALPAYAFVMFIITLIANILVNS
ncbi:hypothetical protein [Pedobacter sp. UC225_65]|uniref:hypothetical protein n=1 Tax=Pedobacter sp. UC225_65 TaxID=3350173 RepID=UPI00366D43D1